MIGSDKGISLIALLNLKVVNEFKMRFNFLTLIFVSIFTLLFSISVNAQNWLQMDNGKTLEGLEEVNTDIKILYWHNLEELGYKKDVFYFDSRNKFEDLISKSVKIDYDSSNSLICEISVITSEMSIGNSYQDLITYMVNLFLIDETLVRISPLKKSNILLWRDTYYSRVSLNNFTPEIIGEKCNDMFKTEWDKWN